MPNIRTQELDAILADQFCKRVKNQRQIVKLVLDSIADTQRNIDHSAQIDRLQVQIGQLEEKKDKLLELSIANAVTMQEFKRRNDRFNEQISGLQAQIIGLQQQEKQSKRTDVDLTELEKVLWQELCLEETISTELVASILDHAVVCEGSDREKIHLELYLRLGQNASVTFQRGGLSFWNTSSKSTTHKMPTRMT